VDDDVHARMIELEQLDAQRARERSGETRDVDAQALQAPELSGHECETGLRVQHDAEQHEGRQEHQHDRSDEQASPHSELGRDVEV
jgi:hypothetical protein